MAHPVGLPKPEELEVEGQWLCVRSSPALCTQTNGDWRTYPHLQSTKCWRDAMRPSVLTLGEFLEGPPYNVYLECPIEGCNMQGCYADHVTSTNGQHFKNLWQKTGLVKDDVPLEVMRELAWEQRNIPGGAIRFNHLDWQLLMWRGPPPQGPRFLEPLAASVQPASMDSGLRRPQAAPPQLLRTSLAVVAAGGGQLMTVANLQEDNVWHQVFAPVSEVTVQNGNWSTLPHLSGGRGHWSLSMKERSNAVGRLLAMHGIPMHTLNCGICTGCRGWEEHVPGPAHYKHVCNLLDEQRVEQAKPTMWQQWNVQEQGIRGSLCFNHLDGEVQLLRSPPQSLTPQAISTPVAHPVAASMSQQSAQPQVSSASYASGSNGYALPEPFVANSGPAIADEDLPAFSMREGETKAEALIGGIWRRVKLVEKKLLPENVRGWLVEEYWGGAQHQVALRALHHCQECQPSYNYPVNQRVEYAKPASASHAGSPHVPARLLSTVLLPNGRKGWKIAFDDGSTDSVPLEQVSASMYEYHESQRWDRVSQS